MNSRIAVLTAAWCLLGGAAARALAPAVSNPPGGLPLPYGTLLTDGPRKVKRIAFTFDDGPNQNVTPELLDLLKARGIKATFFVVGRQVRANPGLVRRMAAEGHLVGCHSDTHPNFAKTPPDKRVSFFTEQLDACRRSVAAEIRGPVHFWRTPYGYDRPWVKQVAKEKELVLFNWTYGSDWMKAKLPDLIPAYSKAMHDGTIYLIHDGGVRGSHRTVELTQALLDLAAKKGYQPVRLDELFGLERQVETPK